MYLNYESLKLKIESFKAHRYQKLPGLYVLTKDDIVALDPMSTAGGGFKLVVRKNNMGF